VTTALRTAGEMLRVALSDLTRRPVSSLLAVLAMAVAMFLLAAFLVLSHGLSDTFARLADQSAVEIYVKDDADPAAVAALAQAVSALPGVRGIERVSPERALAEFRALYPDLGDVRELLGGNPFPGSLRVQATRPDPEVVDRITAVARASVVTESVRFDREWLEALSRLGTALSRFALAGATVLLLAALVTVGSVVRLALDDKREEVSLLRIVGAPNALVTGPVLVAGAILGGAGAIGGTWTASLVRRAVLAGGSLSSLAGLADAFLGRGLAAREWVILAAIGVAAGALAAALAAGRRAWA